MADIKGEFLVEIDGIKYYSDGVVDSKRGFSASLNVGFINFDYDGSSLSTSATIKTDGKTGVSIGSAPNGQIAIGGWKKNRGNGLWGKNYIKFLLRFCSCYRDVFYV